MVRILIIAVLFCTSSFAQTSVIQLKEVLIRYNSAIVPRSVCIDGKCVYNFVNGGGDTLATLYNQGLVDIRATVTIKDTLSRITIIEPNGVLSNTRFVFNGITAIAFNPNNYTVRSMDGELPLKIYRNSNGLLYVEIGQTLTWWHQPIPSATTVSGTQIRRFTLP